MADSRNAAPLGYRDAVCIDTHKIFDSCCDKDCLEDLQVIFSDRDQPIVNEAVSVKVRSAEVLDVVTDVEPVAFDRGFYSIDMTFYFQVKVDVYTRPLEKPLTVYGLARFSKKSILFGGDGNVRVFSSQTVVAADDKQNRPSNNMPRATCQVVDPIILANRLVDSPCMSEVIGGIPCHIKAFFDGGLDGENVPVEKVVLVTLGIFFILQLSRRVQLLIPVLDYSIPEKECSFSSESPCDLFKKIKFPRDDFFPGDDVSDDNCGC